MIEIISLEKGSNNDDVAGATNGCCVMTKNEELFKRILGFHIENWIE